MTRTHILGVWLTATLAATLNCGGAEPEDRAAAVVASYESGNWHAQLVEGAQREGQLTIYATAPSEDLAPIVDAFEQAYGIEVTVWRAGSEGVLNRVLQESRAGRFSVDVIETNGPELESLHREQLLQAVRSPHQANLVGAAVQPHSEWVAIRLNLFVQAYNTRLVAREDLPTRWEDLTDPKWRGKLGIELEDSEWLAGMASQIGEARAVELFREIVSVNGISVRKGHTLLTQLVVSGEVPLALTVYRYKAQQLKSAGAPLDWFNIGDPIARPAGVGLARTAPHPYAAVLFHDFVVSDEGQRVIAAQGFVPTSTRISSPSDEAPMTIVRAQNAIDEYDKWKDLFADIFTGGAR